MATNFQVQSQFSKHSDEYEVEQILGKKYQRGLTMYLIRWKNYPNPRDYTWQPKRNLGKIQDLIAAYDKSTRKDSNKKQKSKREQVSMEQEKSTFSEVKKDSKKIKQEFKNKYVEKKKNSQIEKYQKIKRSKRQSEFASEEQKISKSQSQQSRAITKIQDRQFQFPTKIEPRSKIEAPIQKYPKIGRINYHEMMGNQFIYDVDYINQEGKFIKCDRVPSEKIISDNPQILVTYWERYYYQVEAENQTKEVL